MSKNFLLQANNLKPANGDNLEETDQDEFLTEN